MERNHFYNNKMVTVWNDKSLKGVKFEDFKKQALLHKTYLSYPDELREQMILKDYESINGKKNVEINRNDSESGQDKLVGGNKSDHKGK